MLLAIDIGNTNIVLGLYRGEELMSHWRIATDHRRMSDEYAMPVSYTHLTLPTICSV